VVLSEFGFTEEYFYFTSNFYFFGWDGEEVKGLFLV